MSSVWENILKDNVLLAKVLSITLLATLFLVPGALLILLQWPDIFITQSFIKLIFTCLVVSMPLTLMGILFFTIFATKSPTDNLPYNLIRLLIGTYLMSLSVVAELYIFVQISLIAASLFPSFDINLRVIYLFHYILLLLYVGLNQEKIDKIKEKTGAKTAPAKNR